MRRTYLSVISLLIFAAPVVRAQEQYTITTVAGGVPNNVPALQVGLNLPNSIFKASDGALYIASLYNIYKVDPSGQLTTVAGNGTQGFSGDGGPATTAQLYGPSSVFVDGLGNVFFAEQRNSSIREVVASTGNIQTVAGNGTGGFSGDGGPATSSQLNWPYGVFVDGSGNIFIADTANNRIREVFAATGNIQTVIETGPPCCGCGGGCGGLGQPPPGVPLNHPSGVFVDSLGNLFIADTGNNRIIELVAATGIAYMVAGNGTQGSSSTQLNSPSGVFVDSLGNLFIADTGNNRIQEVVASTGNIQTVAGNGTGGFSGDGGPATSSQLNDPFGLFVNSNGNTFIADQSNNRIREVVASTGNIQTVAGNGTFSFSGDGGPAASAQLYDPSGLFVDSSGNIFIADQWNNRIREEVAATGNIQTVAGDGTAGFSGDGGPGTSAQLFLPSAVFVDNAGNIFVADAGNHRIREVVATTGNIQTVAGDGTEGFSGDGGPATASQLNIPTGVFVDGSGNLLIADSGNNRIREVVASTGVIQTVAGNGTGGFSGDGGPAASAELGGPSGVFVDASGNIFIVDRANSSIREVLAATGVIQTVAGNGTGGFSGDGGPATSAQLYDPSGLFVDSSGNIFIPDGNNRIREVVAATGNIQTVAGDGTAGFSGDGGPATSAQLYILGGGLWADSSGNLLFADDFENGRIRSIAGIASVAEARLSTFSVTFSDQIVSTASQPQTVTVTNAGNSALTITGANLTGTNSADFKVTNGCGTTVAPKADCSLQITFTPTVLGNRTAALVISDNAVIGSPQTVAVSGTGSAPTLGLVVPSGSSSSATVQAGGPVSYTLAIGGGGMSGTASLACTGAPMGAVCSVPSTISVASATASNFSVNVTTTSRTLSTLRLIENHPGSWAWAVFFLGIAIRPRATQRKRALLRLAWLIPLAVSLCACGGGGGSSTNPNGTPAGTYTLTVTATSGSTSQSVTLTLIVQ